MFLTKHGESDLLLSLNPHSWTDTKAWMAITGQQPPTTPPTASDYTRAGLPWFDYYGGDAEAVAGAKALANLSSVSETGAKKGSLPLTENESLTVRNVVHLGEPRSKKVREMPL